MESKKYIVKTPNGRPLYFGCGTSKDGIEKAKLLTHKEAVHIQKQIQDSIIIKKEHGMERLEDFIQRNEGVELHIYDAQFGKLTSYSKDSLVAWNGDGQCKEDKWIEVVVVLPKGDIWDNIKKSADHKNYTDGRFISIKDNKVVTSDDIFGMFSDERSIVTYYDNNEQAIKLYNDYK
jgi:hypothetical protein